MFGYVDSAGNAVPHHGYRPTTEQPDIRQGKHLCRRLFRIDGCILDYEWARLVAHFFRENEFVIEYFGEMLDECTGDGAAAA